MGAIKGPRLGKINLFVNLYHSQYVCQSCRKTIANSSNYAQQTRYASNLNLPFTERLRRKIWGTDNPPGLKDPYGGPGFFERRAQRRKTREEVEDNAHARTLIQEQHVEESSKDEDIHSESEAPSRQGLKSLPRDSPVQNLEKYVPAETWEGLEHIGSSGGWRTLPVSDEELPPSWKERFVSAETVASSSLDFTTLSCIMHQAIVESLISREAGQKEPNFRYQQDETAAVTGAKIILSPSRAISHLDYASKDDQELFIDILSAGENSNSSATTRTEENSHVTEIISEFDSRRVDLISSYIPEDQSFLEARLNFSESLTFTILKRFSGLSGVTIPDPYLNSLRSEGKPLSHLLQLLADSAKPKPKNLAETLTNSEALMNQSNIVVLPRRETPVDKEKEIGRWKVIEKELTERGLPVLGRSHVS